MATNPQFAATVNMVPALLGVKDAIASGNPTTANNAKILTTGGATGTKIEEIVVNGTGTTAVGIVYIWLVNSTAASPTLTLFHLYEQIPVSAVTMSNAAVGFRTVRQYTNLLIPSGWTIRASHDAATTTNDTTKLEVIATGGDL